MSAHQVTSQLAPATLITLLILGGIIIGFALGYIVALVLKVHYFRKEIDKHSKSALTDKNQQIYFLSQKLARTEVELRNAEWRLRGIRELIHSKPEEV
jgi:hypothetical protein